MKPISLSDDREDPRLRYGMEPARPEEDSYQRELVPGCDERVPLHPSVADRSWGESSDEADGEA